MQIIYCMIGFVFAQSKVQHYGNLEFIQNKNQWNKKILYKTDIDGGAVFLEKDGFTFVFKDLKAIQKLMKFKNESPKEYKKPTPADFIIKHHAYKLNFLEANKNVAITATEPFEGYYNYFKGNDKTKWASKVNSFRMVTYKGLYENTDLNIYEEDNHFKYDIILKPGANATNIQLKYEGVENIRLRDGNLLITTSVNEITELMPEAYQYNENKKVKIPCKFKLSNNIITFIFPEGYDNKKELIIDPVLIFSTYSGSTSDNWGFTATFDSKGDAYSGGIVFGTGYPSSLGAYQVVFAGGEYCGFSWAQLDSSGTDVAIIKYDSSGMHRMWATYLGGSWNELPHSMIVNNLDELLIYGTTGSPDFPVTSNAYDKTFNGGDSLIYDNVIMFYRGIDIYISKLSSDGSQLLASTFVGGTKNDGINCPSKLEKNYADGARGEIMTDENNNVYIASTTKSIDFPVTPGAFQTNAGGGGQDGVVFKMDANLSKMIWSSYIGGSGVDAAYGIVLDDKENVYLTGGTTSSNFPTTPGVLYPSYHDSIDGFITKISQNGNSILKSTFYGSNAYDQTYLIDRDKAGFIFVYGQTAAKGNTFINWRTIY